VRLLGVAWTGRSPPMTVFEFVIAIIFIVFAYKVVTLRVHRRHVRNDDAERAAWQQQLEQLEERVKVLERIVTDDRYDLKRQIDELDKK
jgi:cell division protein FtsB